MAPSAHLSTLDGKAFAATAGPGGIGVDEDQALAVEAAGVVQLGAVEVEETFHINDDLDALVFKDLVAILLYGVEVHFIFETRTAAAFYPYAYEGVGGRLLGGHQIIEIVLCRW